jgi:peptidoglycan/LPS O-acetylase OafA/YrhL
MPGSAVNTRTNNFDFLRLVAAVSVVFSHSFLIAEGSEAREPFAWLTGNQCILGLVGVFVFFIISGYLVTESYCRTPLAGQFALRRFLRIYPGLAVNALVCAVLLGPFVTSLPLASYFAGKGVRRFVAHVLMLDPGPLQLPGVLFADNSVGLLINGSLWTLRYEAMMYLMVALLGTARLLGLRSAVVLVGIGIVAVFFENSLTPFGDLGEWAWLVGFFASGMAMYFLRDRIVFSGRYALLALAALVLFTWSGNFIALFPLAGAYLAIWFARRYDAPLDYARYVGDLSYGVYIYGWPSQQLVMYLSGGTAPWWQIFFESLAVALPLAWLSWHGIEKWALRWGRRRRGSTIPAGRAVAQADG